jgi:hypothetical protein
MAMWLAIQSIGRERAAVCWCPDSHEEFHVQLQPLAGLRLLVSLSPLFVRAMLLVRRQPIHAVRTQDAMHPGTGPAAARCIILSRQVLSRVCSAFVIGAPL